MRTRWLVAVILTIALGSACMPEWTVHPRGGPRVAAAGDSILRQLESYGPTHPQSTRALTRSIQDAGWRASVRGENGWRVEQIRDLAADAAARGADGVILVAGVNDVVWIRQRRRPHVAREIVAAQIRGTLADLRGVDCVIWPTVPFGPNYYYTGRRVDRLSVRRINTVLRREAEQRANLVVPEWAANLEEHPGYVRPDGLHLSATGEAALQRVLLRAMSTCLRALAPPTTVPPTTIPPTTTVPPTTIPPTTTVPSTTIPPTTTVPPTTIPPTTTVPEPSRQMPTR